MKWILPYISVFLFCTQAYSQTERVDLTSDDDRMSHLEYKVKLYAEIEPYEHFDRSTNNFHVGMDFTAGKEMLKTFLGWNSPLTVGLGSGLHLVRLDYTRKDAEDEQYYSEEQNSEDSRSHYIGPGSDSKWHYALPLFAYATIRCKNRKVRPFLTGEVGYQFLLDSHYRGYHDGLGFYVKLSGGIDIMLGNKSALSIDIISVSGQERKKLHDGGVTVGSGSYGSFGFCMGLGFKW